MNLIKLEILHDTTKPRVVGSLDKGKGSRHLRHCAAKKPDLTLSLVQASSPVSQFRSGLWILSSFRIAAAVAEKSLIFVPPEL
ncbi:hypothetical protein ACOSQ2_011110 [Xanthoceras sorbifolium]